MQPLYPALIFDTETTGLFDFKKPADDPSQPRMASIAAALVPDEDATEFPTMHRLIKPDGWQMPPELPEKLGNGLFQERLEAEGVGIEDALAEFLEMFDQAEVLAAYGIAFDTKMLRGELRRLEHPDLFGTKAEFCVMRAATKHCKLPPTAAMHASGRHYPKTPTLAEACQILLEREHEDAHSALGDVDITVDLYRWLAARGHVTPKVRPSTKPAAA